MYKVEKIGDKYIPMFYLEIIGWVGLQINAYGELMFWKQIKYQHRFCFLNSEAEARKVIDVHIKHVENSIQEYRTQQNREANKKVLYLVK